MDWVDGCVDGTACQLEGECQERKIVQGVPMKSVPKNTRFTDVCRKIAFPRRRFPARRFSEKLYEGILMYIMCVNTISIATRYVGIRSVY